MAIYLQSKSDPTLYFNGSATNKKGLFLSYFDPITNARNFETREEALEVSEVIEVPVNIVEV